MELSTHGGPCREGTRRSVLQPRRQHRSRRTHTIKFTLKYHSATLLPVMAAHAFGFLLMSPASYERWGKEEVRLHPVGTGPFKLGNWEQNRGIVLEKNPHYFKPGLPYLDRIELRIIKE